MPTILITGSSSGYGLQTAHNFLANGWDVIATMRRPNADVLPASDSLRILPLDVTDPSSIAAAVEASGPFDFLVNNAGMSTSAPFSETTEAAFDEMNRVLFKGHFFRTQGLLPMLGDGGAIVNVASSATRSTSTSQILPAPRSVM